MPFHEQLIISQSNWPIPTVFTTAPGLTITRTIPKSSIAIGILSADVIKSGAGSVQVAGRVLINGVATFGSRREMTYGPNAELTFFTIESQIVPAGFVTIEAQFILESPATVNISSQFASLVVLVFSVIDFGPVDSSKEVF